MPAFDFFRRNISFSRKSTISRLSGKNSTLDVNAHGQPIMTPTSVPGTPQDTSSLMSTSPVPEDVYYNARLDPKNFLEGPLSWNAATRLRQMLARPGIVVSHLCSIWGTRAHILYRRLRLVSAMGLVPDAHSRPDLTAYIRGMLYHHRLNYCRNNTIY